MEELEFNLRAVSKVHALSIVLCFLLFELECEFEYLYPKSIPISYICVHIVSDIS